MKNLKPLIKRVCAYIVDLFIILILASLISSIPILNKQMKSYQKTYDEYTNKYNKYSEYLKLLEESYSDKEINEEEYNKLIELEQYQDIITSKYEDNKISKGEYKKIIEDINNQFDKTAEEYVYILNKKGISNSIITLVCTLLYFGIFQYLLKGQTIGKKLFKLKIVSASNKKLNILNYILRSLIVNDVLLNGIGIIFLVISSKKIYTQANNILGILISISEAIIIYLVLTREDQRGLHDLLFNTKVISTEEPIEENNNQAIKTKKQVIKKDNSKVIEAEYIEEDIVNGKQTKKTGKRKK